MLETDYLRQSPLAGLGLEGQAAPSRDPQHGVAMGELAHQGILNLRGDIADQRFVSAVTGAVGVAPPVHPNTVTSANRTRVLWLGPDEWWVVTPPGLPLPDAALATALQSQHAAVTDVSDYYTAIQIAGPRARDTLAKGCPLDLHPGEFGLGQCAQTLVAKADATLLPISDDQSYLVFVRWSFAEYLWLWLSDAASEYGLSIVSPTGE